MLLIIALTLLPMVAFCAGGGLHIGDKLPEITLNNLLNSNTHSGQIKSLTKGRALIIDFFATWCGSCLNELSKLEQYQKQYRDQLQVLVVSNEKKKVVAGFLNKNNDLKSLPFLPEDKTLEQLFPHREIPHEVWINKDGIVSAITSDEEITDQNLKDFFNGRLKQLPIKKDILDYSEDMPLFKDGNGGSGNTFLSRSILSKGIEGISSFAKTDIDKNGLLTRFIVMNNIPLRLLYDAYSRLQFGSLNFKRVIIDPADTASLLTSYRLRGTAQSLYLVTYEYIPARPENPDQAFSNIFNDLNRYFDISGTIEKRAIPCWVLVLKDKGKLALKNNDHEQVYGKGGAFHNVPLKYFVNALQWYYQMEPVIDETGYMDPIFFDITIGPSLSQYPDIKTIKTSLANYGLDLLKETRNVDVLVIKKKSQ